MNQKFVKEGITFHLLLGSKAIKRQKILTNYKNMRTKLIQEHTMTTQLMTYISVETMFIRDQMKWEWHDQIISKKKLQMLFFIPLCKNQLADIIWIYWGLLHSFITYILVMNYITSDIIKIGYSLSTSIYKCNNWQTSFLQWTRKKLDNYKSQRLLTDLLHNK